ncbi:MAG: hypothetical protein JWQ29_381 [Phenylobacterium sp.]|nr:hypothetical protein [Phenylobacterium sp.]
MLRPGALPHLAAALVAAAFALVASAAHAAADPRPAEVRLQATDEMGPVFADSHGLSLYVWAGDKAGQSRCNGEHFTKVTGSGEVTYHLPDADKRMTCQQMWPPFLASADSKPAGHWGVIVRADGSRQWAYDQKPVYRFFQDGQPGEINGTASGLNRATNGRSPLWAPMEAPGGIVGKLTPVGRVLMTESGKALYARKSEQAARTGCTNICLSMWKPLNAPAVAEEIGDWRIVQRPDGLRQWAYRGRPLYTYAGDTRFGELNGLDEDGWDAAVLQKPLPPPSGLTRQVTSDGEVFADAAGKTLYSWGCVEETGDRDFCDVPGASQAYRRGICGPPTACISTWRPVLAPKNARPVGRTWTVATIDPTGAYQYQAPGQTDGIRVWAYRGRPVYTFAGDKEPGDINGHNVRSFVLWGYSMLRVDGGGRLLGP